MKRLEAWRSLDEGFEQINNKTWSLVPIISKKSFTLWLVPWSGVVVCCLILIRITLWMLCMGMYAVELDDLATTSSTENYITNMILLSRIVCICYILGIAIKRFVPSLPRIFIETPFGTYLTLPESIFFLISLLKCFPPGHLSFALGYQAWYYHLHFWNNFFSKTSFSLNMIFRWNKFSTEPRGAHNLWFQRHVYTSFLYTLSMDFYIKV